MKYYLLVCSLVVLLCACDKEPKPGSNSNVSAAPAVYTTPGDALMGMMKAMKDQDSAAIINVLSVKTRDKIVEEIHAFGGFKQMFATMAMVKVEMTVLGADSSGSDFTKVYAKVSASHDSSQTLKIDSTYFPAIREGNGWKLLGLSGRPVSDIHVAK